MCREGEEGGCVGRVRREGGKDRICERGMARKGEGPILINTI